MHVKWITRFKSNLMIQRVRQTNNCTLSPNRFKQLAMTNSIPQLISQRTNCSTTSSSESEAYLLRSDKRRSCSSSSRSASRTRARSSLTSAANKLLRKDSESKADSWPSNKHLRSSVSMKTTLIQTICFKRCLRSTTTSIREEKLSIATAWVSWARSWTTSWVGRWATTSTTGHLCLTTQTSKELRWYEQFRTASDLRRWSRSETSKPYSTKKRGRTAEASTKQQSPLFLIAFLHLTTSQSTSLLSWKKVLTFPFRSSNKACCNFWEQCNNKS